LKAFDSSKGSISHEAMLFDRAIINGWAFIRRQKDFVLMQMDVTEITTFYYVQN